MKLNAEQAKEIYERIKYDRIKFDEEKHCKRLLQIMADPEKGRVSAFCVEIGIGEMKFYKWIKQNAVFSLCYDLGKMHAKEEWELEGERIKDEVLLPGTTNNKMEHWKMIGWIRFGIGKNSKIRLALDPNGTPIDHY